MKKILLLTLMASLCVFTSVQAYNVYDLSTAFTPLDPNNPFGVWSIGRCTDGPGDTFVLNTAYMSSWTNPGDTDTWWNETNPIWGYPGGWPLLYHNFTPGFSMGIQTGVNSLEHGVVRWTAPSEGLLNMDISSAYGYGDFGMVVMLNPVGNPDPNLWIVYEHAFTSDFHWTGHHIMAGDTVDLVMTSPVSQTSSAATEVKEVFTLYAIGEPGAPAENNIPNPNIQGPFNPDDPKAVWDLSKQFSYAANPGAYWSYGWGIAFDDLNLYNTTYGFDTADPGWYDINTPNPFAQGPLMWQHQTFPASGGICYKDVAVHPSLSPTPTLCKARWTSVIDDFVAITGEFGTGAAGLVDVYVVKDGTEVLMQALAVGGDVPFDVRAWVVPGTTIDFAVGIGPDWGSETTPIRAQITRTEVTCPFIEHLPADLNHDCHVNLEDFALFAQNWLKCNDPMDPACTDMP